MNTAVLGMSWATNAAKQLKNIHVRHWWHLRGQTPLCYDSRLRSLWSEQCKSLPSNPQCPMTRAASTPTEPASFSHSLTSGGGADINSNSNSSSTTTTYLCPQIQVSIMDPALNITSTRHHTVGSCSTSTSSAYSTSSTTHNNTPQLQAATLKACQHRWCRPALP